MKHPGSEQSVGLYE